MNCRICNTTTKKFLDLGRQPIANNFLNEDQFDSEYFYRLEVFFCSECYTIQIGDCPDKEKIFNKNYAFFTSTSNYMIQHFKKLADDIKNNYLYEEGFIVEIGSNDGTFLKNFRGYKHLGIEPSGSVNAVANKRGVRSWNRFFNEEVSENIIDKIGQADVIVTTNCFPHMVDRDSVLKGIKKLLKPKGIWINEEAALKSIMNRVSYDQFYNEHIFFSSIASFKNVMKLYGLGLHNIEYLPVHGGSMRFFSFHKEYAYENEKLSSFLKMENLNKFERFQEFGEKVECSRKRLLEYLFSLKEEIVGYGATAKSTTILNYCKIGNSLISKIYDTTPIKQNKLSPGMHIPIVSYDTFKKDKPKNVVLFAWNHAKEIYEKEKDTNTNWIMPI